MITNEKLSPVDCAWLAGLLEGEGSFVWHQTKRDKGRPRIQCQMTDEDVMIRLGSMLGNPPTGPYGPYKGQTLQTWFAHCSGEQAVWVLEQIYPLMSKRRKSQIDPILNKYKELNA